MKVLHVHSGNLFGGVETTLLAQARHRDPELDMELSFALCFAGRFSKEVAETAAPLHWLNEVRVRNPLSVRRARQQLKRLLQQEKFDVVVTHSCWSQAIFGRVVKEAGLPLVFWLHDAARGRHWLERWAKRTVPDLCLCNSKFTATTLTNLYPTVVFEVVYPPHAPTKTNSAATRSTIRKEFKTAEDAVVIVQVSRMEEWKGHVLHLEALALLRHLPHWICWQVGGVQRKSEERYLSALKKMSVTYGIEDRIRFLGSRTDVEALLSAADIHCQPNIGPEPFGLAFIEALLSSLPVVTTGIGGATEIVDDTCGLLTRPEASAVASSLKRLIEEPGLRLRLGRAGPSRAASLCNVSSQMRRLRNSFATVCQ
jgi:glycosyltransferase involved in cell wall biosynthesis